MRFIAEKSLSYMFNQKVWFIAEKLLYCIVYSRMATRLSHWAVRFITEKSLYCMVYNRKVIVLYGL